MHDALRSCNIITVAVVVASRLRFRDGRSQVVLRGLRFVVVWRSVLRFASKVWAPTEGEARRLQQERQKGT